MTLDQIDKKKGKLDQLRPFSKAALQNLEQWFEVELTYTSNAIEGNTLTRLETAVVLEKGITVGGKTLKEHLEAVNHRDALNFIKELLKEKHVTFNNILSIHELILKGIDEHAGVLRNIPIRISGSRVIFPQPAKLPKLTDDFEVWLEQSIKEHPVKLAALAHYQLVSIHPFVDGNGRTARLLMNLLLMQNGYPPALITPKERLAYLKSLEKAQPGGSLDEFLEIIFKSVEGSLDIYLQSFQLTEGAPKRRKSQLGPLLKIGELAELVQESSSTLRYWVKMGLLHVASTTPSGYQLFEQNAVSRVSKIRAFQKKRLTLEEILEKLS